VSADDVAASFGAEPEVKGASLDGMVTEEMNVPESPSTEEPELDIDLSDIESPF
jgi:hypothetical protein